MSDQDNINDLKDAFDGHSITDDSGQLTETTDSEEVPSEEETAVDDSVPQEQSEEEQGNQETEETNPDVAEDEDGKKYVPEGRFKEVYAKYKDLERKLKDSTPEQKAPIMSSQTPDRSTLLETELLHQTLPQFNPNDPDYSQTLDEMGAEIYQSSFRFDSAAGTVAPTITKLEAARRAIKRAKELVGTQEKVRAEVRVVKSQQSDSGFTSANKKVADKKPEDMSLEEKEAYLKKIGQW